jgi:hypothetical protein
VGESSLPVITQSELVITWAVEPERENKAYSLLSTLLFKLSETYM